MKQTFSNCYIRLSDCCELTTVDKTGRLIAPATISSRLADQENALSFFRSKKPIGYRSGPERLDYVGYLLIEPGLPIP